MERQLGLLFKPGGLAQVSLMLNRYLPNFICGVIVVTIVVIAVATVSGLSALAAQTSKVTANIKAVAANSSRTGFRFFIINNSFLMLLGDE